MGIDDHREGPLLKEYMDRVHDPRDPPGTRWPSGEVTSGLGKPEDSFAAEVRLRRERQAALADAVSAKPAPDHGPRAAAAKRTETISANLTRIAIGIAEVESRLDGVLARFGGGTEKHPATPEPLLPTTSDRDAHFLGSLSGRAADLEMTLKRLSAICDRFEELV